MPFRKHIESEHTQECREQDAECSRNQDSNFLALFMNSSRRTNNYCEYYQLSFEKQVVLNNRLNIIYIIKLSRDCKVAEKEQTVDEFFDLFVVFQYIVIPAQAGIYVNGVYY